MNKTLCIVFVTLLAAACASTPAGQPPQTEVNEAPPSLLRHAKEGALNTGRALITGLMAVSPFKPYEVGTKVTPSNLGQISFGHTTSDQLITLLGHPNKTEARGSYELWYYDYTLIPLWSGRNINESNVFYISKENTVMKYSKAGARATKTGNALLDAANGMQ
jgi:outer membrane protein assembly factor BamE (lipoprotein component of BamABCDE complex)